MKRRNRSSLFKKIVKTTPVFMFVAVSAYMINFLVNIDMPTLLPVEQINVVGETKFLNKDEIQRLVSSNIEGGYFTVDLNRAREALMKQPWLKDVSLRRQWPASVNVFIEEQKPIAYWNDDSYLGDGGNIFTPENIDKSLNLPVLNGPQGQHENVWQFMNVLYKEMAALQYEVVRLTLDERRAWQLVINRLYENEPSQIEVKLGRFDTEKRVHRFIRMLPALTAGNGLSKNNIEIVDMRYPNGFAVKIAEKNNSNLTTDLHDVAWLRYQSDMRTSGV